jgi:hypothetical protein
MSPLKIAQPEPARFLEHDPEKWKPVFPRDKREAFARRSCSNNKLERDDDSKISHPALVDSRGVDQIGRRNNYRLIKQIPADHRSAGIFDVGAAAAIW